MHGSNEDLISTPQLCEWLSIGQSTVNRWRAQGLPHYCEERFFRYRKSEVLDWLSRNNYSVLSDNIHSVITEKQLCDLLQVNPVTAWRWRKEGMPYLGNKKSIRYTKKDVINWLIEKGRW